MGAFALILMHGLSKVVAYFDLNMYIKLVGLIPLLLYAWIEFDFEDIGYFIIWPVHFEELDDEQFNDIDNDDWRKPTPTIKTT